MPGRSVVVVVVGLVGSTGQPRALWGYLNKVARELRVSSVAVLSQTSIGHLAKLDLKKNPGWGYLSNGSLLKKQSN